MAVSTGCSTIRSTLKPWVCDCTVQHAESSTGDDESDEHDHDEDIDTSEDAAHAQNSRNDEEGMEAMGEEESEEGTGQPNFRTVARASEADQAAALKIAHAPASVVESIASVDTTSADERRAFEQKFGISIPSNPETRVLVGNFLRNEENAAVIIPGNSIKIYTGGRLAAQRSLTNQDARHRLDGIEASELVQPVRLVRNGTLQILVHYAQVEASGAIVYKVAIYKVIGSDIGSIFDETLARREAADQPLKRQGAYEFLQGKNHRFIRWTALDADGQPLSQPAVLRWNRWEGVYRVPVAPPTAPKRGAPVSTLAAGRVVG
ncbi:MAG: hypothetical protein H0U74_16090 [Bradymonadaceae bacterium]|nr:hypothetical protein [Lujinxingiaceae bacterium]